MERQSPRRSLILATLAAFLGCSDAAPEAAGETRQSETRRERPARFVPADAIERQFIESLEQALPSPNFERLDDGRLRIVWEEESVDADLTNLRAECGSNRNACPTAVASWVQSLVQSARPLRAEDVRMVVMGERLMREQGLGNFADGTYRLAGDLMWHFVKNTGPSIVSLGPDDLEAAGFEPTSLRVTALANMRRAFGPLRYEEIPGMPARVYAVNTSANGLMTDSYDNARLFLHDEWAAVAAEIPGDVIAAVPDRDTLCFGGTEEPGAVALLQRLVEGGVTSRPHPVSTQLVRWTPAGWEPFTPQTP